MDGRYAQGKNKKDCYQAVARPYLGVPEKLALDRQGTLLRCSEEQFTELRRKNVTLRAYAVQAITNVLLTAENSAAVFALFERDGHLLKLYGDQGRLAELKAAGIFRGTVWSLEAVGPNAVSVGLREGLSLTSVGEENWHSRLRDHCVSFAPIFQNRSGNDPKIEPEVELLGGVAVLAPAKLARPEFLMLAASVASEVSLHIDVRQDIFFLYDKMQPCILLLDVNVKNGRVTINHYSSKIFDLFGVPAYDLYFTLASDLFDPPPQNARFWQSIHSELDLSEEEMTLSVHGKKQDCIVTTVHRDRMNLPSKSVMVTIESRRQMTRSISDKINNAPLSFEHIIGNSPILKSAIKRGTLLANTDSNIMITGESGVGKDVFAQAIHNAGRRKKGPFIAINCGALPRDLIASELFGYEGGAFTGARRQGNIGKFELANGGTLFLDEIGELPLDMQSTLLRVVEQKKLTRLGGSKLIDADVRIIAATNADLFAMVQQQKFRADLYYRLSTVSLNLPPLRDRGEDVVLLAEHFIRTVSRRMGRESSMTLTPETKALLRQLPWVGNVRELQNLMESIVQLYNDLEIRPEHVMENLSALSRSSLSYSSPAISAPVNTVPLSKAHRDLTKEDILTALKMCSGNRSEAARYLGVARKTLYRNMERLGIPTRGA